MSENMKPSGIAWIGDIPESWSLQPLKYISNCNQKVISENTPPTFTFSYVDIGSVTFEHGIGELEELIFEDSPSRARRVVTDGDTIISTVRTYLKAIAYVENSANIIASTGFAVYTPGDKLFPKYLYYFCISEGFVQEVDKFSYGIAYPAINTEILSKIAVAYPELSEQTLIADFLDEQCKKIDSIVTDIENQIEILQKYKKSLITESVTKGLDKLVLFKDSGIEWMGKVPENWTIEPIKYRTTFFNGDRGENYPSKSEMVSDGVPFINAGHLLDGGLDIQNMDYITQEKYKSMGGVTLQKDDILYCLRGSIGKNSIVDIYEGTVASSLVAIRSGKVVAKYLYYSLNSNIEEVQRFLWDNGTAQPNLSAENLSKFKVCLPPIKEQIQIANYLDKQCSKIDSIIESKKEQLTKITQHKKSLIYEYVTGKKRVKGANINGN